MSLGEILGNVKLLLLSNIKDREVPSFLRGYKVIMMFSSGLKESSLKKARLMLKAK